MLGPIGKTAKGLLVRAGYELHRPTSFERTAVRSFWEDWFGRDPALFARVYHRNRALLATIDSWTTESDLAGSLWRYGVPAEWNTGRQGLERTGLNQIEREPTYTDLIGFIAGCIPSLHYLEIGVSVGKNWLQTVTGFPDAECVGLDVEQPHPQILKQFDRSEIVWSSDRDVTVDTLAGTPAQIRIEHHRLHRDGTPATYVRGDQFAARTWASLKGRRFNLIFSDGVHTPEALETELDHLIANGLIAAGPFVMYWDDLVNHAMQAAFHRNVARLTAIFGPDSWSGLYRIHGTYGSRRLNGIFCSVPNLPAVGTGPVAV